MKINREGLLLVRRFEGCALKPYRCPAGILSIGVGHVIDQNESHLMDGITEEEADRLLLADLAEAERVVADHVRVPLNENQHSALVSFVFNTGGGNFRKSTLLKLLNRNEMILASKEFERWVFAGDKKLPGLMKRRAAERALFLKPVLLASRTSH